MIGFQTRELLIFGLGFRIEEEPRGVHADTFREETKHIYNSVLEPQTKCETQMYRNS